VWLSTGGLPYVLRPASGEQVSKGFSVHIVQVGVSGFECRRLGITWCGEFWAKKNPAEAGFLVAGSAFDFIAFGFEEVYKCTVEGFQIIVLVSGFDLCAEHLKSLSTVMVECGTKQISECL